MATDSSLTTTTNSGSQNATSTGLQAPASDNGFSGGTPSTIQPVITGNQLVSNGGIPLAQASLSSSTVALGASTQATTGAKPATHKINSGLLGLAIVLFVVAAVLFWYTGRDDKNTTN